MLRVDFFCRIIFFSFPLFIISCNQEEIDSLNSQLESSSNTINRLENRILELEDELDNIDMFLEYSYYYLGLSYFSYYATDEFINALNNIDNIVISYHNISCDIFNSIGIIDIGNKRYIYFDYITQRALM